VREGGSEGIIFIGNLISETGVIRVLVSRTIPVYSEFQLGVMLRKLVELPQAGMPLPQECILLNPKTAIVKINNPLGTNEVNTGK